MLAPRTCIVNPHPTSQGHTTQLRGGGVLNDDCSSVTVDNLAGGGSLTYTGTTVGATNIGDAVAGSNLDLGGDTVFVFHAFTTTVCTDLAIAYCGTTTLPAIYQAVLSLTCPMDADFVNFSSGEFTSCTDGNATIYWTAVPAGTYYLPVRGEPATAGPYTITVTATACPTAPANDDCETAPALTVEATCVGTPFTTAGATQTLDPILCEGFTSANALDVFFTFTATSTSHTIGVVGFNEADAMVELLEGGCGSLTSMACADATFPQTVAVDGEVTVEQLIQTGLTIGTTYTVRVYDWGHNSPEHNFEICVTEGEGNNIGIDESAVSEWTVFPNPNDGQFSLTYIGANGNVNIEVDDLTGRVVYSEQVSLAKGANHNIDLSGLSAGNYNVRLTANGARTEQRLMVK